MGGSFSYTTLDGCRLLFSDSFETSERSFNHSDVFFFYSSHGKIYIVVWPLVGCGLVSLVPTDNNSPRKYTLLYNFAYYSIFF